jgi:tetratricopeptide (TPR) repeat protein
VDNSFVCAVAQALARKTVAAVSWLGYKPACLSECLAAVPVDTPTLLIEQALEHMRLWRIPAALPLLRQASAQAKQAEDLYHQLLVEFYLARCDYAEHHFSACINRASRAARLIDEPSLGPEARGALKVHHYQLLALVAREKGNFSLALSHWMQVLDLAMQQAMNQHLIDACLGVGEIYLLGQQYEQAGQVYQLAFSRALMMGDAPQVVKTGLHWLSLLMNSEHYEQAHTICQQVRGMIDEQIDPAWRIDLAINEARLLLQAGEQNAAMVALQQLSAQCHEIGYYWGAAVVAKQLSRLWAEAGQLEAACQLLQQLTELTEQQGSYCPAELYQLYAEFEHQRHNDQEALRQLERYRSKRSEELLHLHQRTAVMTPSRQRLLDLTLENLLLRQQLSQVQYAQ